MQQIRSIERPGYEAVDINLNYAEEEGLAQIHSAHDPNRFQATLQLTHVAGQLAGS
jgi:hypothetical protein